LLLHIASATFLITQELVGRTFGCKIKNAAGPYQALAFLSGPAMQVKRGIFKSGLN